MSMNLIDPGYLHPLADAVLGHTPAALRASLSVASEDSTFLRFNHAQVRQATQVSQGHATLMLSDGLRAARATHTLTGQRETDALLLQEAMRALTDLLPGLPPDPHLMLPERVCHTSCDAPGTLPDASEVIDTVAAHAGPHDFVGLYAGGPIVRFHADSRGQRNWHRAHTFAFDWCLYQSGDKAVKQHHAGSQWDGAQLAGKLQEGIAQLTLLAQPAITLKPGRYRAFFAPSAMAELLGTLAWGGFSHKEQALGTSPLSRLVQGEVSMHPSFNLREDTAGSATPAFTADGFTRAPQVVLIDQGRHAGSLCSPRSAREYGVAGNGASEGESPQALSLSPGALREEDILPQLGTGLWISNLHYLNYSDRRQGRVTGMTRFACFWVENGQRVAPLNVMRFDDDLLTVLGERLIALTDRAECFPDTSTYEARQLGAITTPGALVRNFELTL
ncbi:MAG: metallopeptidase TldD-related protein [Aquabacterium sp.]